MSTKIVFRDGLLDRLKVMSGLKTDDALAGAIGVSNSTLSALRKGGTPSMNVVHGVYRAFGLTPGEMLEVQITETNTHEKKGAAA